MALLVTRLIFDVQRTFEFKEKNNKKVKEDVSVDVKENYVQYHMTDEDSEVWVIEDFNRVSIVRVIGLLFFCVGRLTIYSSNAS